ncbi:MAG TPA: hypothetical protein VLT81_03655 [Chondromyces sp.]|nr:hypothetical protein [Chondromyces sp.]
MAARYLVVGMEVACPQCRNKLFRSRKAQLNTAAMSFLNLDWANPVAWDLNSHQCDAGEEITSRKPPPSLAAVND